MTQDLNRYFQIEAEDLLGRITAALQQLRMGPFGENTPRVGEDTLRELRRWAHTLKGAAQVVRREDIAGGAHRLESAVDALAAEPDDPGGPLEKALQIAAELTRLLRGRAAAGREEEAAPVAAEHEIETLRIELREMDDLLQAVHETVITAAGLRGLFPLLERATNLLAMLRREVPDDAQGRRLHHTEVVADEIHDVIAGVRRDMDLAASRIQRELDGLRSKAESLRLVRAGAIVRALEQSVRAAAASLGKLVEFESAGEDLELDAHVLIAARDALIQLARNAVAHGIETPEERVAAGKAPAGRVRVEFRREGFQHVLEVRDDGRGVDFDGLRAMAVERGWLTPERAREASAQDLTNILLRPGVTTAKSAGMLSGRGVGLDLVSTTVARLKGELRIAAEPGKGTVVELRAPASLSSAAVLMVRSGVMTVGVPRDAVRRTAWFPSLHRLGDRYVLHGSALPMILLSAVFDNTNSHGAARVVVEIAADPPFLLGVDALLGVRQTVIHMLPEHIAVEPFILGVSIESEGDLCLIVDAALLASRVEEWSRRTAERNGESAPALPMLVIDDSLTTRMLEQSIFETEGYSVDLASSAEDALSMARQRRYGLFLVDVEMPGMDGVAFVEMTRQDVRLREVPAILVTSRSSDQDRARGMDAGASDYIVKNEFDQRYLLSRVRELMRTR